MRLVPRSRSSAKVKVRYKGYISQKKNGHFGGIYVLQTHSSLKAVNFGRLTAYHTISTFNDLEYLFEKMGKGENAGNQHFLLSPQCFLPFPKQISAF